MSHAYIRKVHTVKGIKKGSPTTHDVIFQVQINKGCTLDTLDPEKRRGVRLSTAEQDRPRLPLTHTSSARRGT